MSIRNQYSNSDQDDAPKKTERNTGLLALSPLVVFLSLYLVSSLVAGDFYKVPISVAFVVASAYAVLITRKMKLADRLDRFSAGAAHKNIMLMIWIFVLAGAFAASAKAMGAVDATVNLTLRILPDNLLLPGIFLAACFISLAIGTSVGTIVALVPVAAGIAEQTGLGVPLMTAVVVGGGIDYVIDRLTRRVRNKRGAELSIAALVSVANCCTANNTIAIITVGPIAKRIADRFGVDPRKSASILDTFSCFVQGLIPYGAQLLMAAGLTALSPLEIMRYLYYPMLMGGFALLSILFRFPRRYS